MLNKFLALILSLCLVIACGLFLASCGGGSDSDTDTVVSDTDSNTDTDSSTDSGIDSDSDDPVDFDTRKTQAAANIDNMWQMYLKVYPDLKLSAYANTYADLLSLLEKTSTVNELNNIGSQIYALFEEIHQNLTADVNEYKKLAKESLDGDWNEMLNRYPELTKNDGYMSRYNNLLTEFENAETLEDVNGIMNSFGQLLNEISNEYGGGHGEVTDADRSALLTLMTNKWTELIVDFPAASLEKYNEKYEEFRNLVKDINTKEDLDKITQNFMSFIERVRSDLGGGENPDDLASAKEEMTTGLQNEWENLSRLYPDLKSSVYAKTYAGLLNAIEEATTVNELNGMWEQFYDLIKDINQNLTPDADEYKKWAKDNIQNEWANLTNRFADLSNDEELKSRYDTILNSFTNANTVEDVEEILKSYSSLLDDIYKKYDGGQETPDITEDQKQDFINHLESEWKNITSLSKEIAKKYFEKYNDLLNRAQNVTTCAEIDNIQSEFKNLLDIIEKEFGSGDISAYKEQVKADIENRWQEFIDRFGSMEDTNFPSRYEEIKNSLESAATMSEINSLSQAFESLAEEVENSANLNGTIAMYQTKIDEMLDALKQNYQDKFTDEINAEIAALREKLNASETVTEAYTNCQAVIDYLSQLEEGFASQPTMDEIMQVKSLVASMREKVLEEYYNTYSEFGEEVSAEEAAILQEIDNVKTRKQLEEIRNRVETEYLAYLEKAALNFAIAKIKQAVNDSYSTSTPSTEREAFKNQVLYVVENCKNAEDIRNYYISMNDRVDYVFQNSDGLMEGYIELTSFYIELFENEVVAAATKKIDVPESLGDLTGYVKDSENTKQAAEKFAEIKAAFESVKDMVYAKKAELNTFLGMEKKLGVTSDELIAEIISEVKVIGTYSDGSTKEFSLTADMLDFSNVNFTKIGNYNIGIHFKNEDFEVYSSANVAIVPDMKNATVVGTFKSTGYFLQDIDMGGNATMTLYSNGFLSFSDRYN